MVWNVPAKESPRYLFQKRRYKIAVFDLRVDARNRVPRLRSFPASLESQVELSTAPRPRRPRRWYRYLEVRSSVSIVPRDHPFARKFDRVLFSPRELDWPDVDPIGRAAARFFSRFYSRSRYSLFLSLSLERSLTRDHAFESNQQTRVFDECF